MKPVLNFFLCSSDGITATLLVKLSAYYHKMTLNYPIKLILCLPFDCPILTKPIMFDENVVCRFRPEEKVFWETKELQKYLLFISHSSNMSGTNILIADNVLFRQLNKLNLNDVVFAKVSNNHNEMVTMNNTIAKALQANPLADNDLTYYDASLFIISESVRAKFQEMLIRICRFVDFYITKEKAFATMSIIATILQKQRNITVGSVEEEFTYLSPNSISDFYLVT